MVTLNHIAIVCAALMGAHWLYILREGFLFERRSRRYLVNSSLPLPENVPLVTVLVPARNEAAGLGKCLESLIAQKYPRLEIIAIDDRSTDATGKIMDDCATRSNGRLKVIHVQTLPEGWLGKNHALHLGTEAMSPETDFILFTDGDVIFDPDTVGPAIRHCETEKVDHFVLSPLMISNGPWLAAVQLVFGIGFLTYLRPSRLGKSKDVYVGIGAFNLVRRSFYEASGGHRRLHLEVIDDGMLGKILVAAGARADMINGKKWLTLEWYPSVGGFVRGLEKNGFAVLRYSILMFAGFVMANLWMYVVPYVFVATTTGLARASFIGLITFTHVCFAIAAAMLSMNPLLTFLVPPSSMIIVYTIMRSTVLALWRGGIYWRETHHSLEELKANMI